MLSKHCVILRGGISCYAWNELRNLVFRMAEPAESLP